MDAYAIDTLVDEIADALSSESNVPLPRLDHLRQAVAARLAQFDVSVPDPEGAAAAAVERWDKRKNLPLEAAVFYAAELARGVPALSACHPDFEVAFWREIVEREAQPWPSEGEYLVHMVRHYGTDWRCDFDHIKELVALWNELVFTIAARHHLVYRTMLALSDAQGFERTEAGAEQFLDSGVFDDYPAAKFGLPYYGSPVLTDQIPHDLDAALVLRRWLVEHPPTVAAPEDIEGETAVPLVSVLRCRNCGGRCEADARGKRVRGRRWNKAARVCPTCGSSDIRENIAVSL